MNVNRSLPVRKTPIQSPKHSNTAAHKYHCRTATGRIQYFQLNHLLSWRITYNAAHTLIPEDLRNALRCHQQSYFNFE